MNLFFIEITRGVYIVNVWTWIFWVGKKEETNDFILVAFTNIQGHIFKNWCWLMILFQLVQFVILSCKLVNHLGFQPLSCIFPPCLSGNKWRQNQARPACEYFHFQDDVSEAIKILYDILNPKIVFSLELSCWTSILIYFYVTD